MEDIKNVKDTTPVEQRCADCGGPLTDTCFILLNGDKICPSCLFKQPEKKDE